MILDFKKIFADEDGTLSFDYNMDLSETKVSTSYPFVSPVRIKGTAVGKDGFVQLGFRVSFDFSIPCDRCARRVDRHYRYSFSHVLVHSLENKEEDDRFVEVPNERLNLDELAREDILLELPTKFLCREDCRGICPVCGKNLNDGPCGCDLRHIDPRFDVLRNLIH